MCMCVGLRERLRVRDGARACTHEAAHVYVHVGVWVCVRACVGAHACASSRTPGCSYVRACICMHELPY